MFTFGLTKSLVVFFIIGYTLLLLPIIVLLKSNDRGSEINLRQIQGKGNINLYTLVLFFLISGLPLTNVFLLKWYCLVNVTSTGNYYILILFIVLNIITVLFYYSYFNKVITSYTGTSGYTNSSSIGKNCYYVNIYLLFGLYYNVFGFLFINYILCLI